MPDAPSIPPAGTPAGPSHVRAVAVGIVIHHDHVLLGPVVDRTKRIEAYRPLGGAIEFGERAEDAIVREFREETGCAVEVLDLIAVSENLFTFEGRPGHEIVFQYLLRFTGDGGPSNLDPMPSREDDGGAFEAVWVPLAEVVGGMHEVYPDGFPARLAEWINRQ